MRKPALKLKKPTFTLNEQEFAEYYADMAKKHGTVTEDKLLSEKSPLYHQLHKEILNRGGYDNVRKDYPIEIKRVAKKLFLKCVSEKSAPQESWFNEKPFNAATSFHGGSDALLRKIMQEAQTAGNTYSFDKVEGHLKLIKHFLGPDFEIAAGYSESAPKTKAETGGLPTFFFMPSNLTSLKILQDKFKTVKSVFDIFVHEDFKLDTRIGRISYSLAKPIDAEGKSVVTRSAWLDFSNQVIKKFIKKV
ncbi:MAG: hypothetical protein V1817_03735 [Candidatus Micrarchaeota archaeon]